MAFKVLTAVDTVVSWITGFSWPQAQVASLIHDQRTGDNPTTDATIRAQSASSTASAGVNENAGALNLEAGARDGAGLKGAVRLRLNAAAETMMEAVELIAGQRVVALCRGSDATTTQLPANTGDRVIYIADCATAPTANPVSGGVLYSSGGDLYWRSSGGVTSQLN